MGQVIDDLGCVVRVQVHAGLVLARLRAAVLVGVGVPWWMALALLPTSRLLLRATGTAAQEGLVEVAVKVLGGLALELTFGDLRAEAETWACCSLGCHHHVLVEAHAGSVAASSRLIVSLEA